MTIYPSDDEYKPRKVTISVDDESVIEMMVWSDSPEQAAYQVCKVGRSMLRAHLDRLPAMERYNTGQQRTNEEDAGADAK